MKNRMYVDFHVLQTVPPSCVNRDDIGQPKTAVYGGTLRARVSSQAWKHAMRRKFLELFPEEQVGKRTKKLVDFVAEYIAQEDPSANAAQMAQKVLEAAKLKFKEDAKKADKSPEAEALFFISCAQAKALAHIAVAHPDMKYDAEECKKALQENPSVDIALFGRMAASNPELNTDASAQVAHAISTHTVSNEYDYFTAVDDCSGEDNTGAGHLGTVEYNSSTLYRYATVNVADLAQKLHGDTAMAVREFAEAFVQSMPTGKQNSFANATLPDVVYVTVRKDQPLNLCGAFEKAVRPSVNGNAGPSAAALKQYAENLYEDYDTPVKAMTVGKGMEEIAVKMSFHELLDALEEEVSGYLTDSAKEDQ